MKTFESYRLLTAYDQGKFQKICTTDENGFRKYDDRYCVAVGTNFNMSIGQYFDVQLENGIIIKCVVGDIKADEHTDKTNTFTTHSWCCTEFIVDRKLIPKKVSTMGDVSYLSDDFNSKVVKFTVYDIIVLEDNEI